jgi:serine phosphatase RsbU (regulator of sigma subunit)
MAAALYIPMNSIFVGLAETRYWYLYIQALTWFPVIEVARGMRKPIKNKVTGAWIVGAGMLVYTLYIAIILLILVRGLSGANFSITIRSVVILFLTGAISIFLARQFARTSLDLESQLAQVKQLSEKELEHQRTEAELRVQHAQEKAENERRARELEEARQLQLSMLPKNVPQLPNLEIAAYMKPAAEVGGDYYDFHLAEDGTLTVAVGDATGHGLKAGMMVTAVKGLFETLADATDIKTIFQQASRALKRMKLRALFMAMLMAKIKASRMIVCVAGMPPVLIYRAQRQEIEEVALRGMPWGSVTNYPYKQIELELAAGDVVLLMSDGFPELFNEQGEMLDYARARTALAEAASGAPHEIIQHLVKTSEAWAGNRPQDDDVTFVVLKVKEGKVELSE